MPLVFSFLIGFFAGLRSLTAPAVIAWAAYLGILKLEPPLALIGSLGSVVIFTLLALGELVADKLPRAPNRTDALGLVARIFTGGLTGACIAVGFGKSAITGAIIGAAGGIVGCYVGFHMRMWLTRVVGNKSFFVALFEDVIAIAGCVWVVMNS